MRRSSKPRSSDSRNGSVAPGGSWSAAHRLTSRVAMAWCWEPAGYCRSGKPTRATASPTSRAVTARRRALAATPLGVALLVAAALVVAAANRASRAAYTWSRTRHGSRRARILSTSPPIVCTRGRVTTFRRVASRSTRVPVSAPSGGGGASGSGTAGATGAGAVADRGGPPGSGSTSRIRRATGTSARRLGSVSITRSTGWLSRYPPSANECSAAAAAPP